MNESDLLQQNPWWLDRTAILSDPHLNRLTGSPVKWSPDALLDRELDVDRVYTLRGPRQVGKTTLVKSIIGHLLERGVDPMAIMYFSCEMLRDARGIVRLVDIYQDKAARLKPDDRRYMFLDEITYVRGWERGIKHLVDIGRMQGTCMVLTGSHSLDLKYSTERLPGRRGEGPTPVNRVLLPMRFWDYITACDPELGRRLAEVLGKDITARHALLLRLLREETASSALGRSWVYIVDLQRILGRYLLTGGVARAAREYLEGGTISSVTYELYVRSLIGDLGRWRYQEDIAKSVVNAIIDRMTTRIGMNTIAKEMGETSHNTVSRYLSALEGAFVVNTLHQLVLHRNQPSLRKERKVYIQDPFILHALRGWARGHADPFARSQELVADPAWKGKLVEMVVAQHLSHLLWNLIPSDVLVPTDNLFYWRRQGTEQEVDFVLRYDRQLHPIECKYQQRIERGDLRPMATFGHGLVLSKDTLETRNGHNIVPVELFLALV